MIKQKGIIVLILLVIVLLVAYLFYTRYGPNNVIENFDWVQPNGGAALKQVSVNFDGSVIWGVNSGNDIFYTTNNGITGYTVPNPAAKLKQVSVSGNGEVQWGVYYNGWILYSETYGSGPWVGPVAGGSQLAEQVSVNNDGTIVWLVVNTNNRWHVKKTTNNTKIISKFLALNFI